MSVIISLAPQKVLKNEQKSMTIFNFWENLTNFKKFYSSTDKDRNFCIYNQKVTKVSISKKPTPRSKWSRSLDQGLLQWRARIKIIKKNRILSFKYLNKLGPI